jgi:hypothetical protein
MTMPNLWNLGLASQLRMAGDVWEVELDGECVVFRGIFDQQDQLTQDDTGKTFKSRVSAITCRSSVAERFSVQTPLIDERGKVWYVRMVQRLDDGELSQVQIVQRLSDIGEIC